MTVSKSPTPEGGSSRSPQSLLISDTSSTDGPIQESLEERMKIVRNDLGPTPEVTVEFMLKHIIPDSNVDVEATMNDLKAGGVWSEMSGWDAFERHSPKQLARNAKVGNNNKHSDMNSSEPQILRRMKAVYASIVSYTRFCGGVKRAATLNFDQTLDTAHTPETRTIGKTYFGCVLRKDQAIHSSHQKDPSATSSNFDADCEIQQDNSKHTRVRKNTDSDTPNWFDIACAEEYKDNARAEDINDVRLSPHNVFSFKSLTICDIECTVHNIMRVDHRRRFVFGITIENEDVRIWFACRQIVTVTQPFNFRTNVSQLVRLISSLAYATPTHLGYDPTMALRWRNPSWHYDVELTTKRPDGSDHTVLYRTVEVLSDTAYNIRGRATRVYLAEILQDNNNAITDRRLVLKDAWIDSKRPREGDTLSELLVGASEDEKALFLTVFQHGVVQINHQDDSTHQILKGQKIELPEDREEPTVKGLDPYTQRAFEEMGEIIEIPEPVEATDDTPTNDVRIFYLYTPRGAAKTKTSTAKKGQRSTDALSHYTHCKLNKPTVYLEKVHYRIAFEEVGTSLMQMANSGMVTTRVLDQAMRDTTMALKYMAKKGYVHRDVSAGNIIMFNKRAKLSDLEFAKKYTVGATSDSYVRTGTYSFMAGEVMHGRYSVKESAQKNAAMPFVHNPIHDLESLWWVGVWCLMWHYPAPFTHIEDPLNVKSSKTPTSNHAPQKRYIYREFNDKECAHMKSVRINGEHLFPPDHGQKNNIRMEEIHSRTRYSSHGHNGYTNTITAFVFRLNMMRQCISWAYRKIQRDLPRNEASYFVDTLCVANPSVTKTDGDREDLEDEIQRGIKIPVYDRIIEMLGLLKGEVDVNDTILWPLDSIEEYNKCLAKNERLDSSISG